MLDDFYLLEERVELLGNRMRGLPVLATNLPVFRVLFPPAQSGEGTLPPNPLVSSSLPS